jgi:RHS repeat-associated protein
LPGFENRYLCPSGVCDTTTNLSSQWFVYDSNNLWDQAPTDGKLTKIRTLACRGNSSNQCVTTGDDRHLFNDVIYAYTPEGNTSSVTRYSSYGYYISHSNYAYATGGAQATTFAYADGGHNTFKTTETNAATHAATWVYDYRMSVPTQETDPNSIITTAEYDSFGRMTKVIRPGDTSASPTVLITYRGPGSSNSQPFVVEVAQKHSGGALTVRRAYNGLGWLLQQQTAGATVNAATNDVLVDYQYNAYGQMLKQSVPYAVAVWGGSGSPYRSSQQFGTATSTTYDVFGRVTQVQSPTAAEKVNTTYISDLATQACDGRGNCSTTIRDLWGRVVEVHPALDPWLRYSYDAVDRLLKVEKMTSSNTVWATTQLNYDTGGRKSSMIDPDLGTWYYKYNGLNNLVTQTDARGCITTLSYNDPLNRVTSKSYSTTAGGNCGEGGATVNYTYDDIANSNKGKGKRTGMSDALSGTATWFYGDNRGRLTKETRTFSGYNNIFGPYVTEWAYDSGDQMTSMTYPYGEVVNYTYRPQMAVNTVIGNSTYVQDTQYDAAGRTVLRTLGANQQITWYNYNSWTTQGGRLKEMRSGTPGTYATANPSIQYLEYDYDAVGNVNWIKDYKAGGQQQSFIYDALDRLTGAAATGGDGNGAYSQSYSYDAYGRLATGPLGTYTYGDANHKHAVTAVGSYTYSYDANGNMSSRTSLFENGPLTYAVYYDAENRLRRTTNDVTATYDGDGVRVFGEFMGGGAYYVGNYYEVINGHTHRKYYYAGNERIAWRQGALAQEWIFNDHPGSTGYLVSGTTTTSSRRYKAWGETRYVVGWPGGVTPLTFGYTGQREETEEELGLYYYGARHYDPALGRFLQPDTIVPDPGNPQAYDRYAYVNNNPLKYNDPTGHILDTVADVISKCYYYLQTAGLASSLRAQA